MSRLIDADALERDGWQMSRTVRVNKDVMEFKIERLKEQVYKLERKYCDNCQEFVCDFCHEMDDRCEEDE